MKRHRPWDKQRQLIPPAVSKQPRPSQPVHSVTTSGSSNNTLSDFNPNIPFVNIGNKIYYSDRFYLNTCIFDPVAVAKPTTIAVSVANRIGCDGTNDTIPSEQLPLFDRSEFVKSYFDPHSTNYNNMQAILFGTYTVDATTLRNEFPNIFASPTVHTPCLVLYGKKNGNVATDPTSHCTAAAAGPATATATALVLQCDRDDASSRDEEDTDHIEDCVDDTNSVDTMDTIATQDEATLQGWKRYCIPHHDLDGIVSNRISTKLSSARMKQSETNLPVLECPLQFPESVHFSQIISSWWNYKTSSNTLSFLDIVDPTTGFLRSNIIQERQTISHGVHHSKYIIVFEKDGSMTICISTANLVPSTTTDATWIQRFPPAVNQSKFSRSNNFSHPPKNNDFGMTLTNYLQCTMLATAANDVTVHWFVQKYLHWKSIRDLERCYDYSSAQVQLVTVIPGEYNKHCNKSDSKRNRDIQSTMSTVTSATIGSYRFLCGQERISYLVQQLKSSMPQKLSKLLFTDSDRLIIQPTSFGGGWNISNMSDVIRSYLGQNGTTATDGAVSDHDAIQRLEIVWPTDKFVVETNQNLIRDPSINIRTNPKRFPWTNSCLDDDDNVPQGEPNGGFLFLSSESFNKIDLACLNRMVLFQPSIPSQRPIQLIPHFKSVTRLIYNHRAIRDYFVHLQPCEDFFSWFLLTSACLSRGAQGDKIIRKNNDLGKETTTAISYTNFEMGILFGSHVSAGRSASDDRLYCWNPTHVSLNSVHRSGLPRLIHLPVPYDFRLDRYVKDVDVALFSETPYFHEIPLGTGCEGNMQLTPYGAALAKESN